MGEGKSDPSTISNFPKLAVFKALNLRPQRRLNPKIAHMTPG